VQPFASVAVIVNEKEPVFVGVRVVRPPPDARVKPGGSAPAVTAKV